MGGIVINIFLRRTGIYLLAKKIAIIIGFHQRDYMSRDAYTVYTA